MRLHREPTCQTTPLHTAGPFSNSAPSPVLVWPHRLYRVHKSGSVSTRSQLKFALDCLLNSEQIAKEFQARGIFEGERKKAVGWNADYFGKQIGRKDPNAFSRAIDLFEMAKPESLEVLSWSMQQLVRFFGYKVSRKITNLIRSR